MEFRNQDGDLRLPLASSSSSSLVYNPPPIRGSAFSKPALPPPSAILSPKAGGGGGGGDGGLRNGSSPVVTEDISSFFGRSKVREPDQPAPGAGLPGYKVSEGGEEEEEVAGKYKECLRNHAAAVGGHVVDGCGEFMPNGGPSTPDALKCAACGCHRSFHRKDGDGSADDVHPYHLRHAPPPLLLPPPPLRLHRALGGVFPASSPTSRLVPVSSSGWMASATTESSSEERVVGGPGMEATAMRKRFRTKFTAEQKEKMLAFADRIGWRFQRQDEALVEQFCSDAGIKRHVLKVWMHNNKHSVKKQQHQQQQQQQQRQQPPSPSPSPQEQHQ
ncbi:zinc-finger homeodomain protein 5-like [Curcuma longa]|uniref:zinc-finger homeodomain protein 5-like n=1 Tax=Curcuma longa TaxID=136217 RepID=UPI003D9FA8E4